jgi:uncharacterized protein YkuJ
LIKSKSISGVDLETSVYDAIDMTVIEVFVEFQ